MKRRSLLLSGLLAGCGTPAVIVVVDERTREQRLADIGVRIHINSPAAPDPARPTRLLVYALPNGSTLEQTLGAPMRDGVDGRFDIQHVAAQARQLRALTRSRENLVFALVEAQGLSWPAWRRARGLPEANARIAALFAQLQADTGAQRIHLSAHSGGGSFIHGLIEAGEIPASVDRISYLDANYSFEAADHGDRFMRWLDGDASRGLIVLAYDDRRIELNGKLVVGPTGGTWRATDRMISFFGPCVPLKDSEDATWLRAESADRRLVFIRHKNPDNKILHTRLVGEMNGLLMAAALGTAEEARWGSFGGPRAYEAWVR